MGSLKSWITASLLGILLCAPISAQVTQRVSVDSDGEQGDGWSDSPSVSSDGRYLTFQSQATNLLPGDTNGAFDIFVRDRQDGATECVSLDSLGTRANNHSVSPRISADGRYVVFQSFATNLVPGDTNGFVDVFIRDRQSSTTERISVDSSGTEGNGLSETASLSADGRYVVFDSYATNLVPADTNGFLDVFIRDRMTGTTELVSVSSGGVQGDGDSTYPSITPDGRYVAFASGAENLASGDTNGLQDVFVRDRQSGTTERVRADGFNYSIQPSISADGRYVAFQSIASNLVPGDTNGAVDIFVCDRQSDITERVSVDSGGAQGNNHSFIPSISGDGRYVVFYSHASNLVIGDTNGFADVFLRDRQGNTTERMSINLGGQGGNDNSYEPSISADGRFVAIPSAASNLVPGDVNRSSDVFVRDRLGGPNFTSLCDPDVGGVIRCPCLNPPSATGRGCDNSAATGGAILSASGGTYLSSDSLTFSTSGERPTAFSILLQWTGGSSSGDIFGMGVRCTSGTFKRLYTKAAAGGSITAPNFVAGDPTVSARSAALGNVILAGEDRWYFVFYRDPNVLGGCPPSGTFNATQTGQVTWSP